MEDYEIERCADILLEAEEIKADEEKMEKVLPILEKKKKKLKKQISSIADLKAKLNEPEEMEDENE